MSRRCSLGRMVLIGLCLAVLPALAVAEESVYKKGVKSTVWVVQPAGGTRFRMGSGSLIDAQKRLILTNYHVVTDQKDVVVFFPVFDTKGNPIQDRDKY